MAFRFPSLSAVLKGILDTIKRFPLPLLSAITGSLVCIYMLELKWDVQKNFEYLFKVVMCCWLAMNLFLAICLFSERKQLGWIQKYVLQVIALGLVVGYYFLLPEFRRMTVSDVTRYALFTVGLHLLVAFVPFIGKREMNGFWQFNKALFLRFLLSVLYSGVLYAGLALALVAIDQLFGAHIKGERFGQLWIFMAGIFNTWFFLAGIPDNIEELETTVDYPKGLKIFTQFILLPLVTIYLLILYAYGIKIIVQWELPKGWVSYLVNAFSVFGILSLLLIWPIRNDEENKWINIFSRWFYRALFPLIILLGVAIGKRVMQYGVTEKRYLVLIVALWLAGIAMYFLLSKTKNIKAIPVSLCLIAFLSSFGPWGAFSVSEKSQVKRLEQLLTEEKILLKGKIEKNTDTLKFENGKQIVSIVKYLDKYHGFGAIKSWFKEDIDTILVPQDSNKYVYEAGEILALMGVEDDYYNDYRYDEEDSTRVIAQKHLSFNVEYDNKKAVPVSGFDYSFNINRYVQEDTSHPRTDESYYRMYFGKDSGLIKKVDNKNEFIFSKNGKNVLKFNLDDFTKKVMAYRKEHKKKQYDREIPYEQMFFEAANDSVKMNLYVTNFSGTQLKDDFSISDISGTMLLKFGTREVSDKK